MSMILIPLPHYNSPPPKKKNPIKSEKKCVGVPLPLLPLSPPPPPSDFFSGAAVARQWPPLSKAPRLSI